MAHPAVSVLQFVGARRIMAHRQYLIDAVLDVRASKILLTKEETEDIKQVLSRFSAQLFEL